MGNSIVREYSKIGNIQMFLRRSRAYNSSACLRMDGYVHSDGYCYYTPNRCSLNRYYASCQCYNYYTTSYTNATCINIRGSYYNGRCYYNSSSCCCYSVNGQCYNRMTSYSSYSSCRRLGGYYYGSYRRRCYYNVF